MTDINKKFNSIPMILLLVSILIIPIENLKNKKKNCTMPTRNNECMNFVFGDSVYKKPACKITSAKCNQRFFTNPVTTVINNQKKFALSLYSKMGQCKAFGKECGKLSYFKIYFKY